MGKNTGLTYYVECELVGHNDKPSWVTVDWVSTRAEAETIAQRWSEKGETKVGRVR